MSSIRPCSHLTSAFASKFENGFYGNECWCSYLTFAFDGNDQRKTQTQTPSVNKALVGDLYSSNVFPATSLARTEAPCNEGEIASQHVD